MAANKLEALRKASERLLYPSETDAPFEVFALPAAPSAREALEAAGKLMGNVDEVSLDKLFADLAESDDAAKFAKLKQAIRAALSDAKVFRVDETNVDVYMVGKAGSGAVAGLHTTSVET